MLVLKLNTDENPLFSQRAGIQGIPTFIAYSNGSEASRRSGAMPIEALSQWLDPIVTASGSGPRPSA